MIVTGDSDCTGARSPGVVRQSTFPTRVRSTSIGTGRGPEHRASAYFINLRSTRRLATWAGVVVGSRRKATRLAHLWQAHRLIAEARGKTIRAKRTEQNPTN